MTRNSWTTLRVWGLRFVAKKDSRWYKKWVLTTLITLSKLSNDNHLNLPNAHWNFNGYNTKQHLMPVVFCRLFNLSINLAYVFFTRKVNTQVTLKIRYVTVRWWSFLAQINLHHVQKKMGLSVLIIITLFWAKLKDDIYFSFWVVL